MFGIKKLRESLTKTRSSMFGQISDLFVANEISDDLWDELESILIQADVGVDTALYLVERLQERVTQDHIKRPADALQALKAEMRQLITSNTPLMLDAKRLLTVVLIVGVNGSGKTTSVAKMAYFYIKQNKQVILGAADTYRAAAIDQLEIWGERAGAPVISHQPGADPGAVVYDTLKSALGRRADLAIIDTAGRLHTKFNLMKELEKIHSIAGKQVHAAPHETLLVLDATTGQNALSQAKHFKESAKITGVILTKLDSTAKGGVVFAIHRELGVPVRFIGTGEGIADFDPFDADAFIDGLFEE